MLTRPAPRSPARPLPAALLVVLAALAALLGVPGLVGAASGSARSTVGGASSPSGVQPGPVRPSVAREAGHAVTRRGVRDTGAAPVASTHATPRAHETNVGPGVALVATGLLLMLGLAARATLGPERLVPGGRTPGARRDRAPPAYALG